MNGKNIAGLGEKYRDFLGYLPQHFGYYPDFTALDFLLYVSALKGLDDKSAKKKSKELLESVGLSAESKRKIKTFSGGMKQRLGIAQAMLNDPHILILDEPTAGLDPKERVRFRNLISAFAKRFTQIVVMAVLLLSVFFGFTTYQNMYAFDGVSQEGSGRQAVEIDKSIAEKYAGILTDDKVQQMMIAFKPTWDLHGMNGHADAGVKTLFENAMLV